MKKLLQALLVFLSLTIGTQIYAQEMIELRIIQTGVIIDDESGDTLAFSADDAEQENDEIDALDDDDLDAGWEGQEGDANILTMGLRFQNVTIPRGATIDSAWVVVYSHEGKSAADVANITIYGIADDSTGTFTEDSLISDRPATESQVEWVVAEDWIIYFPYRTPDLTEIVQEITDRDGWKSGNALAFVLAGENQGPSDVENAREMEAFENIEDPEDLDNEGIPGDGLNHPERIPTLVVYYTPLASAIGSQKASAMRVYPNPAATDRVTVALPAAGQSTTRLFDATGKLIRSFEGTESTVSVDLSGVARGLYILKTTQEANTYTQKLIVE